MQLLQKKQQKEREKRQKALLKFIGLIICIGAPILTYFVGGGVYHRTDAEFVVLLYFTLIMVGACVLAIDEGVVWWLIVCLYASMWIIMLVGIPNTDQNELMTDAETQKRLIEAFVYSYAMGLFLSGIFGLVIRFIIRQLRTPD